MLRPKIQPAILVVLPATVLLTAQTSLGEPTAGGCRTGPGLTAPQGTHWYYRINRADNRRCWFLSSEGVKVRSHARGAMSHVASPSPTPQHENAAETVRASQTTPAPTASAQKEPAQAAAAELAFPGSSLREHGRRIDFAMRWPDLPNAQDLDGSEFSAMRNSYAERDAMAQIPLRWPVIEAERAQQASAGEGAFGSVFLAGALVGMASLLLAGGVFKLARRPRQSYLRDDWCGAAGRPGPRRHMRADFVETGRSQVAGGSAARRLRLVGADANRSGS